MYRLLPLCFLLLSPAAWGAASAACEQHRLASRGKRHEYQRELVAGLDALAAAGCTDVYVLAHSLGSVIAVDALQSGRLDHAPIRVLHTIGSPLDKFWYFDRTHRRADGDVERLSRRGLRWRNSWSWSDPVSGRLDHFASPSGSPSNRHVADLWLPLVSHGRYWGHPAVLADVVEHAFGPHNLDAPDSGSGASQPGGCNPRRR